MVSGELSKVKSNEVLGNIIDNTFKNPKARVALARWRSGQSLSGKAPREVLRTGGLVTGTVGGVAT